MEKLLQRLREERAELWNKYEALRSKNGDKPQKEWETTDRNQFVELHERIADVDSEIDLHEATARRERFVASQTGSGVPDDTREEKPGSELRQKFGELICSTTQGEYNSRFDTLAPIMKRDMQVDIPGKGGFVAMPMVMNQEILEPARRDFLIRRLGKSLPPVPMAGIGTPELTARPAAAWGTELTLPTFTDLGFAPRAMAPKANVCGSKIARTLLREWQSGASFVLDQLGYAKAYLEEQAFFKGDGVVSPLGITVASDSAVPTGQNKTSSTAGKFSADDLIDMALKHVRPVYFNDPSFAYIMSPTALAEARKLKDGAGQYICTPTGGIGDTLTKGAAYSLLGKPVYVSEFMDAIATGSISIIAGAWQHYWVVDSIHQELMVLPEKYADENKVGYILRGGVDAASTKNDHLVRLVTA